MKLSASYCNFVSKRPLKNVHFCLPSLPNGIYFSVYSIGTGIHTLSISRINPPKFGDGLKFEADVEIGQKKGRFAKVSATYTYQGLLRFDSCQFSFLLILNPHEKSK
jgi:hypothetical protein